MFVGTIARSFRWLAAREWADRPGWLRIGIAILGGLLACPISAEDTPAPPACAAICTMEAVCKTIDVVSEDEREPFCLASCQAPALDPAFRSCLAKASDCEVFSGCVDSFTGDRRSPSPSPADATGALALGASVPTTPCSGTPNGCTYPEVCCTQTWGGGNRSHRQHVCGEYHCPPWCVLGLNPACAWCSCPRKHDVYPNWPPAPAQQLALASFDDKLVLAYRPYQVGAGLNVTLSSDGQTFDGGEQVAGVASRLGPSLAPFKGRLVMAYRQHHEDEIQLAFSVDGETFRPLFTHPGKPIDNLPGARSRHPPAVAGFQDQLHVFFVARHKSDPLYRVSSTDGTGVAWSTPTPVGDMQDLIAQPAVAAFRNRLFLAYPSTESGGRLVVASSDDLERWSRVSWLAQTSHAPALAVFQDRLVVVYNDNHDLVTVSSSDGVEFVGRQTIPGQFTSGEVALAHFGPRLYLAYKANDSSNTLWVTSTADGVNWDRKIHLPNQTTP